MGFSGGEIAATVIATTIIGTGIGSYIEVGDETEARETAIAAQACLDTYGTDKDGAIAQLTLDCLKKGWTPDGHKADSGLKAGEPNGLYIGYIQEERTRGSHIDVQPILAWAAIGVVTGLIIASKMDTDTSSDSNKNGAGASVPSNSPTDAPKKIPVADLVKRANQPTDT